MLGIEPFYMEFISGVENVIASRDIALLLHVVDSAEVGIATYEKWWAQRRVDGVLLVDLLQNDPRIDVVREANIPAVCVSSIEQSGGLPTVWTDDGRAMRDAVNYLVCLGHRRIARVGGIPTLSHTITRDTAFREVMRTVGVDEPTVIETDFSGEAGARATRALLTARPMPTAIIYDNDIMAVAGLSVANEMRVSVPNDVSLLAWDDSPLCQITHPALSAMHRDVSALGVAAAELLIQVIEGEAAPHREGDVPVIHPRGSTTSPSS